MRALSRGMWSGALLLGVVASGWVTGAAAAEFRGFVTDGPAGLLVFQPCQGASLGARGFKLTDRSPDTALTAGATAVRQVMEDKSRPLYVEFAGESAANTVTVRRFQRAIGHIVACAGAPKDIVAGTRLVASGANPSWRFVATTHGAQLQLPPARAVRFAAAPFSALPKSGPTQVFDAWSAQDGGTIRVEVTEQLCLDEPTETASGARVTLRYTTNSVEGCAARF